MWKFAICFSVPFSLCFGDFDDSPPECEEQDLIGVTIQADFLYWQAVSEGIPYAITGNIYYLPSSLFPLTNPTDQTMEFVEFGYTPAYSVGVGYLLPVVDWELYAKTIHYQNSASANSTGDFVNDNVLGPAGTTFVTGVWNIATGSLSVPSIAAHQKITLNVLDILLRKKLNVQEHFFLQFSAGARLASLKQKLKIYSIFNNPGQTTTEFDVVVNNFNGAGGSAGLGVFFDLFCGFGLSAEGAYSLLSGKSTLSKTSQTHDLVPLAFPSDLYLTQKNKISNLKSVFDLSFGAYWSSYLGSRFKMKIYADYDLSFWPNQNEVPTIFTSFSTGVSNIANRESSVSFKGLRVGTELGF